MAKQNNTIDYKKFFINTILPSLVTIILFIVLIFSYVLPYFKDNLLKSKKEMTHQLINTGLSITKSYYNEYRLGNIDSLTAKANAIKRISDLRYGKQGKDYFFIIDKKAILIEHPYRKDLVGKNLSNFKDRDGKNIFREMVQVVDKSGEGFVTYKWEKPGDSIIVVPKISYVQEFKPWGWIIGTGIYVEDVNANIRKIQTQLIVVSVAITFIIAILLIVIIFQNYKTEIKRLEAESELLLSQKKYKMLVEASNEASAIILEGDLVYSNPTFKNMFSDLNFKNISNDFRELITPANSTEQKRFDEFFNNERANLQIKAYLSPYNNKNKIVVATLTKVQINEKTGFVIIIKELNDDTLSNLENEKWSNNLIKLLEQLNFAMFKVTIGDKPEFIEVNDEAAKLFNFSSKNEMLQSPIMNLTDENDFLNFINIVVEQKVVKNFQVKVRKSSGELFYISVDAVYETDPIDEVKYVKGIFKDISNQVLNEDLKIETYAEIQSSLKFLDIKLKRLAKEPVKCDENMPVKDAVNLMLRNNTDIMLIIADGEPVGVITDFDIRSKYINSYNPGEILAKEIMHTPIFSLNENYRLSDALTRLEEKRVHHLFVNNSYDIITGVVGLKDIIQNQQRSSQYIRNSINISNSIQELAVIHDKLAFHVQTTLAAGISSEIIIGTISSLSKEITAKVVEIIFSEIGQAPCEFAFIAFGSEGRNEQSLITNQYNAIIYDDINSNNENVESYFLNFGEKVNNYLEIIGYSFCKDNVMAKNKYWNQPLNTWKKYFKDWINDPLHYFSELTMIFDMKLIYGKDDLVYNLRDYIFSFLSDYNEYDKLLKKVVEVYKANYKQIKPIQSNTNSVNVKTKIKVIVNIARLYSIKYNLYETNTLKRLRFIYEKNIITGDNYKDLTFSYKFLTSLILKNQLNFMLDKSESTYDFVELSNLSSIEVNSLKNILNQLSIFQSRLYEDFDLNQ